MFETLVDRGLAFRGLAKEAGKFYLHDDVYEAIVNYFEKEFQEEGLSSWHDKQEVQELHIKLIDFYKANGDIGKMNSAFEIAYHTIMLKQNFEKDFDFKRENYIDALLSSMSLSNQEKLGIVNAHNQNKISTYQQKEFIRILKEEITEWSNLFSPSLYNELKFLSSTGRLPVNWPEDLSFLLELSKKKNLEDDWYLFFNLIGRVYYHKQAYDQAIEAYQKAIEINPKDDEAYYNMGNAYDDKQAYDKAIEAYKKAIEINPKNDKAYANMENVYYHQKIKTQVLEILKVLKGLDTPSHK
jgi:tetratricopeptide (TPR) repeat protein